MSNPAYPGSVKIGQTRKDPEERRKELGTTGVLQDFVLEYRALTEDYESLEKEIHRSLAKYRVRDDREFFSISTPEAINKIRGIAGGRIESDKVFYVSPEELQKIEKKAQEQFEETQERVIKEEQRETAKFFRRQSARKARVEQEILQRKNRVSLRPGSSIKSRRKEEEHRRLQAEKEKEKEATASLYVGILYVVGIGVFLYFQFFS